MALETLQPMPAGDQQLCAEKGSEIHDVLDDLPSTEHAANALAFAHFLLIRDCAPPGAGEIEVRTMMAEMTEAVLVLWRINHRN